MAANDNLLDPRTAADEIWVELKERLVEKDGSLKDGLSQATVDQVLGPLTNRLRGYNTTYHGVNSLYSRSLQENQDLRYAFENQIKDLQKKIQEEKERKLEDVSREVASLREERAQHWREMDAAQVKFEAEKEKLIEARKEAERQKAEVEHVSQNKDWEINGLHETFENLKETIAERDSELASQKRDRDDILHERNGYKSQINDMIQRRETAEKNLADGLQEMSRLRRVNLELQEELSRVKPELQRAQKSNGTLQKDVKDLEVKLADATEELENLRRKSPTTINTSQGKTAFDELGSDFNGDASDTETNGSESGNGVSQSGASSRPVSGLLEKEKERYQQLQATIGSDYIPRVDHEQVVQELAAQKQQLKNVRQERDILATESEQLKSDRATQVQTLQDTVNALELDKASLETALKRLQEANEDKENSSNKSKEKHAATIKELQSKINALEDEANSHKTEITKHKSRVQDLEKQLSTANAETRQLKADKVDLLKRVTKLEQIEREQQTKITDLSSRPKTSSGVQTFPDPRIEQKEKETKALSTNLEAERARARGLEESLEKERALTGRLQTQLDHTRMLVKNHENELTSSKEESEKALEQLRSKLTAKDNEYGILSTQLHTAQEQLENCERVCREKVDRDEFNKIQEQHNLWKTRYEEAVKERERLRERVDHLRAEANQKSRDSVQLSYRLQGTERDFRNAREDAQKFQEKLLAVAQNMANEYRDLTGEEIIIQTDRVEESIKKLMNSLRQLISDAQKELDECKKRSQGKSGDNAALEAVIKGLQGQIEALIKRNQELEELLRECKENNEKNNRAAADDSDMIARAKEIIARFLGLTGQSIEDFDKMQLELTKLRREADDGSGSDSSSSSSPGSEGNNAQAAEDLDKALKQLADCQQEHTRLEAEVKTLQDTIATRDTIINDMRRQADRTQAALHEQIAVFDKAQRDIVGRIEHMSRALDPEGQTFTQMNRQITAARREIDKYKVLVQTLTVERDLLREMIRSATAAQQRDRDRRRANAGEGAGAGNGGAGNDGRRRGGVDGRLGRVVSSVKAGLGNLPFGNFAIAWRGWIMFSLAIMMVIFIIAEGSQHAAWRKANAPTRALWMVVSDQPSICLSWPRFEYFWHATIALVMGRWVFRGKD